MMKFKIQFLIYIYNGVCMYNEHKMFVSKFIATCKSEPYMYMWLSEGEIV